MAEEGNWFSYRGQSFEFVGYGTLMNKQGALTLLTVWESNCIDCGAPYEIGLQHTFPIGIGGVTRRCGLHRKAGALAPFEGIKVTPENLTRHFGEPLTEEALKARDALLAGQPFFRPIGGKSKPAKLRSTEALPVSVCNYIIEVLDSSEDGMRASAIMAMVNDDPETTYTIREALGVGLKYEVQYRMMLNFLERLRLLGKLRKVAVPGSGWQSRGGFKWQVEAA